MIIFAQNPALKAMLIELAKRGIGATDFAFPECAAVMRNDRLAAVAVYHNYAPPDIQMSFYALTPRWAHPSTIRDLLGYPFLDLRVKRVTALVKRGNKRSRKMVEGLGWKLEGVVRKAARDGGDLILYGMVDTEFGERYGHRKSTLTAAGDGRGQVRTEPGAGRFSQTGGHTALAAGADESDRCASDVFAGSESALSRSAGTAAQHHASRQRGHGLRLAHG